MLSISKLTHLSWIIGLCLWSAIATASDYWPHPRVMEFIEDLVENDGFDREQLIATFYRAQREERALPLIKKAPEAKAARKVNSWQRYQDRFLTAFHTNKGRAFRQEHGQWLELAQQRYGVDPNVIVAIIGVETNYGTYTGDFSAMNVMTTLSFEHPRRQKFYRRELKNLLLLARAGNDDVFDFSSSYAGAMGMPQFMPSSFRAYAVDHDGDGRKDIWQSHADVIGSVANYLKNARWRAGEPVATRVEIRTEPEKVNPYMRPSIKPQWRLDELQDVIDTPEGWRSDLNVALFSMPQEPLREYWLGTNNLHAIARYNPSRSYALVVHMLAERVAELD